MTAPTPDLATLEAAIIAADKFIVGGGGFMAEDFTDGGWYREVATLAATLLNSRHALLSAARENAALREQASIGDPRIIKYLAELTPEIGCGDDPNLFLIASHGMLRVERDDALRKLAEAEAERKRAVREAWEAAAKVCEAFAEEIKHTSHRDGLGMGDQRSEGVCVGIAARIRASTPSDPTPRDREESES